MRGSYRLWQARTALRNRLAPGAVILVYHRVEDSPSDGLGLAVSAAHFGEHLDVIRALGVPVRLAGIVAELYRGHVTQGAVGVTFDDGYADNLLVAKPLLERREVPATVCVTSGFVGSGREFWWDEIERIAVATSDDVRDLRARLRFLAPAELEAELGRMRAAAGERRAPRTAHRPLTADETARLASGGLVDIGSHTVTHAALARLSSAAQHTELVESRRTLESIIGRPVLSLSYPFGGTADIGEGTAALAVRCGYQLACANWPGTVTRRTDRMRLPRFPVRDWDGDELAKRLGAWLTGRRVLVSD